VLSDKWSPELESAYKTSGNHRTWATQSLQQAVKSGVYDVNLKDGRVETHEHEDDPYVKAAIVTPSKTAYVRNHVALGQDQLMKATVRLAALLNAIEWK